MTDPEILELADGWVAYWRAPEDSAEQRALFWATDAERELVRNRPQEAWKLILAVLAKDDSSEIQEVLSAGPLEDLLADHGESIIATVEAEARANPSFAVLLGGVWQNAMSAEVWARVQAVWDRRGWDGNPEA